MHKAENCNPQTSVPKLIYLAWGRLQRPRANLIQTLHTLAGLQQAGLRTRLYLPPWPGTQNWQQTVHAMGIDEALDIRPSHLLHRRWAGKPFIYWYKQQLTKVATVYTRVPELSLHLARSNIRHHLEIHNVATLQQRGLLPYLIEYQRNNVIGFLLPISQAAADVLLVQGAKSERIHIAPSGVAYDNFAAVSPLTAQSLQRPRLGYIGRVSQDRGSDILAALAQNNRYEVIVIGPRDDSTPSALATRATVTPREVPNCYATIDFALLPYQTELQHAASISPLKLFEAFAAGRPVIASDLPALRELIQDGHNGLLVSADDPAAWQAAIERLRNDTQLIKHLIINGRRTAQDNSWQKRAARIATALGLLH